MNTETAHSQPRVKPPETMPIALIVLVVMAALGILGSGVVLLAGLGSGNPLAVIGGVICVPLYIAIVIGLVRKQEWARIMLLWLAYCGVVGDTFRFLNADRLPTPLAFAFGFGIAFEVATIVLAHSKSVRAVTRRQSMAKEYIYQETPPALPNPPPQGDPTLDNS